MATTTPKEAREEVKRDAPRVGGSAADVAKAPLYPTSGGSYTRTADGGLRQREKPTEPVDRPEVERPPLTAEEEEAVRRSEAAAERAKSNKE